LEAGHDRMVGRAGVVGDAAVAEAVVGQFEGERTCFSG
jgi:hypothetical protein